MHRGGPRGVDHFSINDRVAEAINRRRPGLAFHQPFLDRVYADGVSFGCGGVDMWRGSDAETCELYQTNVPSTCDDPETIADAILAALGAAERRRL